MTVSEMLLLVVSAPRRRRGEIMELRARLQDALSEDLSTNDVSLTVIVKGGVVTVRGEVGSLDQISRASRVIDRFRGDTEIVNLVRVRALAIAAHGGGTAERP